MNTKFKQELQEREFLLLKNKKRVLLRWATGCGKSKMVIDLINADALSGKKPKKVLFVVAERAHIKNWQDEFDKWHLRIDRITTDVCCYASLNKYVGYDFYDAVVFDEAHHVFSEKRLAALEEMRKNMSPNASVYLLSATLSKQKQDVIEEIFGKFTTSTVTLKDAIESDILPDPKFYVVEMELDNKVVNQEIRIGNDSNAPYVNWEDRFKFIHKKLSCNVRCTQLQKYIYMTDFMEYWKRRYESSHNQFQHNLWVNMGSQRKRYLGELKTVPVHRFIQSIRKDNRYVCFCASVNQATMLSSNNTLSAKNTEKYNSQIINAFNTKKINSIYAVGMITEGMNLTDIQTGIIVQLDGKERLFIQKAGRAMRACDPTIIIFYYKNTQDEIYLKKALENIDEKYVKHITINQLKTIKL